MTTLKCMNTKTKNLQAKLNSWRLDPSSPNIVDQIYTIAFKDSFYREIWDEPVLLGLAEFMVANPPDSEFHGSLLTEIAERKTIVQSINDLFFSISNATASSFAQSLDSIARVLNIELKTLESSARQVRESSSDRKGRIAELVEDLIRLNPGVAESVQGCFEAYQSRQEVGMVNGLLVKNSSIGIVLPVRASVQAGSGRVDPAVPTAESFVAAVNRARAALTSNGWLSTTQDIIFTVENTEASYTGSSISLPSLAAIYSSAREYHFDPYTGFTGNIDQRNNQWRIVRVEGIPQKLAAAQGSGLRRVILPSENKDDVHEAYEGLELIFADDLTDLFAALTLPKIENPETVQQQKILEVHSQCSTQGWQLSAGQKIKDALQFTITPAVGNELILTLYDTGTHSPKDHRNQVFQPLLERLARLDSPATPIQSVQQGFNVKDVNLRDQIKKKLQAMAPSETRQEQHCDYSFVYETGNEKLIVKQYSSGKLQLQGRAGPLYRKILDIIIPLYNIHYSNAALNISDFFKPVIQASQPSEKTKEQADAIELPHIGTDESGKGDYFGPLVIAGVWVDERLQKLLIQLGVRDSKKLSDSQCRDLAGKIRDLCPGKYHIVEISPEKYNQLHEQFLREKKNLNHLLAWGHARAIESLLERQNCSQAVADQFGDEKYITSKLMEKGKTVQLKQTPKAERFIAVAAASVLARDRFLSRLEQLSAELGIKLPKGASPAVIEAGRQIIRERGVDTLSRFAKLHFKTTDSIRAE